MNRIDIYQNYRYYKYNYLLLDLVGSWPLSDSKRNLMKLILMNIIFLPALVGLFLGLDRAKADLIRLFDNLNVIVMGLGIMIYLMFNYALTNKQINLINTINQHWSDISSKEELKIMEKFTRSARYFTLVYTSLTLMGVNAVFILCLLEPIFDKFLPLQTTGEKVLPCYVDYGVNEEEYYYYIFFHLYIAAMLVAIAVLALDSFYVTYIQHILALFSVVRFRLKSILEISGTSPFLSKSMQDRAHKRLMDAVNMHKTALEYTQLLQDTFRIPFLFVILITVCTFICIMVQVLIGIEKIRDEPSSFFRPMNICIIYLIRMYILTYPADRIIHSSNSIYDEAYAIEWYKFSKYSGYVVQILILRSLHPFQIKCGMIDLNIVTFSKVVKTAMSYATVFVSASHNNPNTK